MALFIGKWSVRKEEKRRTFNTAERAEMREVRSMRGCCFQAAENDEKAVAVAGVVSHYNQC